MHILEAARIIGELGGRPRKYKWEYRGGGFVPTVGPQNGYQTEDLLNFYTDETGLNIYVTEN